jgi:hypothetical protein
MRWVTREHVRTEQARRRSLWHRWFAWYPVVVSVEGEFDHRVWLEHLERKWSVGRYRNHGHWRYRYPVIHAEHYAEQYDVAGDEPEGRHPLGL